MSANEIYISFDSYAYQQKNLAVPISVTAAVCEYIALNRRSKLLSFGCYQYATEENAIKRKIAYANIYVPGQFVGVRTPKERSRKFLRLKVQKKENKRANKIETNQNNIRIVYIC